ncbi:MAG TPA: hypothetical protein ENH82_15010 [bacterium]|nr:hypothetical protein [bacterium]
MKKQITTRITIDVEGDRCGQECPIVDRQCAEFGVILDFDIDTSITGGCFYRCQACLDAEKEADEQLTQEELDKCRCILAELGARDEQIDIRDALIAELVDVLTENRKQLMSFSGYSGWTKKDIAVTKNAKRVLALNGKNVND